MGNVNKDLRNTTVDGKGAKDVEDTQMLEPGAKEWSETVTRDNPQEEFINKGGASKSGPFGAKGHGGG